MRKYSEKMFNKMVNGVESKVGNHECCRIGENFWFKYHGNAIFVVDFTDNAIFVDNCGYCTSSTTQAINSHLEAFFDFFPYTSSNFDFVDLTENMKFDKKIVELFRKHALSESEFVEKNRNY